MLITLLGIYFSGTGNTKHAVEEFIRNCNENGAAVSIETPGTAQLVAAAQDTLVLGCPVYFSNIPKIVRDFVEANAAAFAGKSVFLIATQGLFSGDGAGCAARLLEKHGAVILGGLHVKMPDNIGDARALKKTRAENQTLIARADKSIAGAAQKLQAGRPTRDGLGFGRRLCGLLGQRLWFYGKTISYKQKPDVNRQACNGCGRCAAQCPMNNIRVEGGKATGAGRCTLCYRCVSLCPQKALTILGRKVYQQYLFDDYQ